MSSLPPRQRDAVRDSLRENLSPNWACSSAAAYGRLQLLHTFPPRTRSVFRADHSPLKEVVV
jgi:hypothetical protein